MASFDIGVAHRGGSFWFAFFGFAPFGSAFFAKLLLVTLQDLERAHIQLEGLFGVEGGLPRSFEAGNELFLARHYSPRLGRAFSGQNQLGTFPGHAITSRRLRDAITCLGRCIGFMTKSHPGLFKCRNSSAPSEIFGSRPAYRSADKQYFVAA
jgi:hypothetical protein